LLPWYLLKDTLSARVDGWCTNLLPRVLSPTMVIGQGGYPRSPGQGDILMYDTLMVLVDAYIDTGMLLLDTQV
jgi:hypothetical protein